MPEFRFYVMCLFLSVCIAIINTILGAPPLDIAPQPNKLRLCYRAVARVAYNKLRTRIFLTILQMFYQLIRDRNDSSCGLGFKPVADFRLAMLKAGGSLHINSRRLFHVDAVPLQAQDFFAPHSGIECNHTKCICRTNYNLNR